MARVTMTLDQVLEALRSEPDGRATADRLAEILGCDVVRLAGWLTSWSGAIVGVRCLRASTGRVLGYRLDSSPLQAYCGPSRAELMDEIARLRAEVARLAGSDHGGRTPIADHGAASETGGARG